MKKLLFILLLTSCSSYKSSKQHSSSQQSLQEQHATQLNTQHQQQQFSLLQQVIAQDSQAYRILIRTEGNYRLHPDSGIIGTGASIWISGSRQSMTWQQKKVDSSRSDSQQQLHVVKETQQQVTKSDSSQTEKKSPWKGWLIAGLIILGLAAFCQVLSKYF
ncbi:hypothetical protein SAMN05216436_11611 [bacterium A37T11]|nr:hypothetical protein SAMN05216436_11611 [bacterium A37T11]